MTNRPVVEGEIWKPICGYDKYEISNTGKIYSHHTRKILSIQTNNWGYECIIIRANNRRHKKYIHREVAKAFIPNPENKTLVDHDDNDKLNNHVSNLRWCDKSENAMNSNKQKRITASKYKGVWLDKRSGKWHAEVICKKIKYRLGSFKHEVDAAMAYNIKAVLLFGEYARINDLPKPIIHFVD